MQKENSASQPLGVDVLKFANLLFRGLTRQSLFQRTVGLKMIVTVNSEYIVRANTVKRFRNIICENYATFDGQIPFILARLLRPGRKFEKISGSDLIYSVSEYCRENKMRLFLLGGESESNRGSISTLRARYNIDVDGFSPPKSSYPFSSSLNESILRRVKDFSPDFLLVGFGTEKQEYWISDHRQKLESMGIGWAIGVGGTFEFVSGRIPRAPKWCQSLGLEGVYRLMKEPRFFRLHRLWKSLLVFKYVFRR